MIFSKAKHFLMAALVGLAGGVTSCEDESFYPEYADLEQDFILSIETPEGFRSRATTYFGDGALNELHLKYAIFGYDGKMVYSSDDAKAPKATSTENGRWQLKLRLAEGMDYTAFFWADQFGESSLNHYSVDLEEATLDVDYNKAFTPENLMYDRCDAYAVYKDFKAGTGLSFTLKRPFCQVNVGSPEPSVVEGSSPYHNKRVTLSWDDNILIVNYSFANGSAKAIQLQKPVGVNVNKFPWDWPGMRISDFDNADFDFVDSPESKYMYMAYLLVCGKEDRLNLYIEGTDEDYAYHPTVTGKVAQNSRLIVVPQWVDGGDGFIDPRNRELSFVIKYDPGFDGDSENIISEVVKVDIFHTLSWTIGNGVKSVTINGKTFTEDGSLDILEGTKVDWEATPEDDYQIDGAESGFVTMTGDQHLDFTASPSVIYYTLSWTISEGISWVWVKAGSGSTYYSSGSIQIPKGTKVNWSVGTEDGWDLEEGYQEHGSFTMNRDTHLEWNVSPSEVSGGPTFSWSIDGGVAGITVNGSTYTASGSIPVVVGSTVSWNATAKDGYVINGVSSGSVFILTDQSVKVTSSPIATPDPEYTFSWSGDDGVQSVTVNGSSYGASGSIKVKKGTTVSWSASAKSGYHITGGAPGSVVVNGDEHTDITTAPDETPGPGPTPDPDVTFSWVGDEGVASVTVNGQFYSGPDGSITVKKGTTVSWNATAKAGYKIKSGGSGSIVINRDETQPITTEKEAVPDPEYTFSWSGDAGVASVTVNGSSYGASGSIKVKKGTTVSYSAAAKTHYEFVGSSSGSVTVNGDESVSFSTKLKKYPFSWTIDEGVASITVNGSTYTADGSIDVEAGSTVSWSASAKSGYVLMPGSTGGSVTINGSASVTVSSKKEVKYATISWTADEGVQSVTVNGRRFNGSGSVQVEEGTDVSVSATLKSGYTWVQDASSSFHVYPRSNPNDPDPVIELYFTTQSM